VLAAALVLAASLAGPWLAVWLGRGAPARARALCQVAVFGLLPLQIAAGRLPWTLANALQWPDLLFVLDAWLPVALLIAVAAALAQPAGAARARTGLLGALLVVAALAVQLVALRAPPPLDAAAPVRAGVVLQSAPSSCGAAATATLLRALAVDPDATEAALAARCRTDPRRGTSDLGLQRGLLLSAPGRSARFGWPGLGGLRARTTPCLVFVGLDDGRPTTPEHRAALRDRAGWAEGVAHAVVFYELTRDAEGDCVWIGDPRIGRERWPLADFEALWSGLVLQLD
jgi:hypothetical protein